MESFSEQHVLTLATATSLKIDLNFNWDQGTIFLVTVVSPIGVVANVVKLISIWTYIQY